MEAENQAFGSSVIGLKLREPTRAFSASIFLRLNFLLQDLGSCRPKWKLRCVSPTDSTRTALFEDWANRELPWRTTSNGRPTTLCRYDPCRTLPHSALTEAVLEVVGVIEARIKEGDEQRLLGQKAGFRDVKVRFVIQRSLIIETRMQGGFMLIGDETNPGPPEDVQHKSCRLLNATTEVDFKAFKNVRW